VEIHPSPLPSKKKRKRAKKSRRSNKIRKKPSINLK
jgi:hypothetical protein